MKFQTLLKHNLYVVIVFFVFVGLVSLTVMHDKMQDQLDVSWMYSLNYAVSHNFSFGNQIIFTYGPLSFLGYDIIAGLSTPLVILSTTIKVIYIVYFYFLLIELYNNIKTHESKDISFLITYFLFPWLVFKVGTSGEYTLIFFVCFVHSAIINVLDLSNLYLAKFFSQRKILLSCFTAFAAAILFFLKVSFLPFVLLIPCVLLITFVLKRQWNHLISFLSVITITFFCVFIGFKIALHDYLMNSLEIIAGYKKTMQFILPWIDYAKDSRFRIISIALALLYCSQFLFIKSKYFIIRFFLVFIIILLGIYYCYLYSFTRGFSGGIIFGLPILVFVLFFGIYLQDSLKTRINNIILLILLLSIVNFGYKDFRIFTQHHPDYDAVYLNKLPQKFVNRSESYDVYPCLSSICYFNNLKYSPRPVIQAYSAYTPKLDVLDADFFSKRKVDNIIFFGSSNNDIDKNITQYNAIDGRYFLFDEPSAKFEILKNYAIKYQVNDSTFIAGKRKAPVQMALKLVESRIINLNEPYNIKQDTGKLYFFTSHIKYSSRSKILSLIDRNPYIKVGLLFQSGKSMSFNVAPDLLINPCVLTRYCANYNDFFKLAGQEYHSLEKIKSIAFIESKAGGFDKQIEFKVYELSSN